MQFRQLETFAAVYENRSFAGAARTLFLSQPAVSQQIQALETELGTRLFERNRHLVVATPAGDTFYPYARRLLSLQAEALAALRPNTPDLHLHFVSGDVHDPIQQVQLRYYSEYPEARIRICPPLAIEAFTDSRNLEAHHLYMVRQSWLRDGRIHFFPLGIARYSVLLHPLDALCAQSALRFADLNARQILGFSDRRGPFMGQLNRQTASLFPREKMIDCEDILGALSQLLHAEGKNVLLLPYFVSVPGESRFIRRPFLAGDEDNPIGLCFVGEATPRMSQFLQLSRSCYQ